MYYFSPKFRGGSPALRIHSVCHQARCYKNALHAVFLPTVFSCIKFNRLQWKNKSSFDFELNNMLLHNAWMYVQGKFWKWGCIRTYKRCRTRWRGCVRTYKRSRTRWWIIVSTYKRSRIRWWGRVSTYKGCQTGWWSFVHMYNRCRTKKWSHVSIYTTCQNKGMILIQNSLQMICITGIDLHISNYWRRSFFRQMIDLKNIFVMFMNVKNQSIWLLSKSKVC